MVTNGLNHYFCTMNHDLESFEFLETIPNYTTVNKIETRNCHTELEWADSY